MTLTVRRRDLWALYETYMTHLTFQLSIYKTVFNLFLNQKADLKAFQIIHNTIDIFLPIYPPPCCVIAWAESSTVGESTSITLMIIFWQPVTVKLFPTQLHKQIHIGDSQGARMVIGNSKHFIRFVIF